VLPRRLPGLECPTADAGLMSIALFASAKARTSSPLRSRVSLREARKQRRSAKRVWVHSCAFDHPSALAFLSALRLSRFSAADRSRRQSAPRRHRATRCGQACSGYSSCPDLIRVSNSLRKTLAKEMDGRAKPGHDELYRSGEPARADQLTLRIAEKPRSAAAAAFPRCRARRLVRIAMPSRLDSRASGCAATDRAFDARA
jgi:hypothetical protein